MIKISQNQKFKNPIFWLSLMAIMFASAGVEFSTLTSWQLLGESFLSILANPVSVVSVIVAVIGVFNDNSTKGIDKLIYKKDKE